MVSLSEQASRFPTRPAVSTLSPAPLIQLPAQTRHESAHDPLTTQARRLGRRRLLAFQAVDRCDRVVRGDCEIRRERARLRAAEARIEYVRAIDRLWETGHSDEAILVYREMSRHTTPSA